jgi:hypothetical protein
VAEGVPSPARSPPPPPATSSGPRRPRGRAAQVKSMMESRPRLDLHTGYIRNSDFMPIRRHYPDAVRVAGRSLADDATAVILFHGPAGLLVCFRHIGRLAQKAERSLSMREAPGSIPGLSINTL